MRTGLASFKTNQVARFRHRAMVFFCTTRPLSLRQRRDDQPSILGSIGDIQERHCENKPLSSHDFATATSRALSRHPCPVGSR